MSCVVVPLMDRESLSVVGSSSEISSSQESIICEKTAACLCPVSSDKQQPDYNHLSHTHVFSEVRAACPHWEDIRQPVYSMCVCEECVKTILKKYWLNKGDEVLFAELELQMRNHELYSMSACLFMSYANLLNIIY